MQNSTGRRKLLAVMAYLLGTLLLVMAFLPAMTPDSGNIALAGPAAAATKTKTVSATKTSTVSATRTTTAVSAGTPSLSLAGFSFDCTTRTYQVGFAASGFAAAGVKTFGAVSYMLGGLQRTAKLTGTSGNNALYVDSGTLPRQLANRDTVDITGASVTLGTDHGNRTLTAPAARVALNCTTTTATATATSASSAAATTEATSTLSTTAGTSGTPTTGVSNRGGSGVPAPSTAPATGSDINGAMPFLMLLGLVFLGAGLALGKFSPSHRS